MSASSRMRSMRESISARRASSTAASVPVPLRYAVVAARALATGRAAGAASCHSVAGARGHLAIPAAWPRPRPRGRAVASSRFGAQLLGKRQPGRQFTVLAVRGVPLQRHRHVGGGPCWRTADPRWLNISSTVQSDRRLLRATCASACATSSRRARIWICGWCDSWRSSSAACRLSVSVAGASASGNDAGAPGPARQQGCSRGHLPLHLRHAVVDLRRAQARGQHVRLRAAAASVCGPRPRRSAGQLHHRCCIIAVSKRSWWYRSSQASAVSRCRLASASVRLA